MCVCVGGGGGGGARGELRPRDLQFYVLFNIADPDLHKDPASLFYCLYKWSLHYSRVTSSTLLSEIDEMSYLLDFKMVERLSKIKNEMK